MLSVVGIIDQLEAILLSLGRCLAVVERSRPTSESTPFLAESYVEFQFDG